MQQNSVYFKFIQVVFMPVHEARLISHHAVLLYHNHEKQNLDYHCFSLISVVGQLEFYSWTRVKI